MTLTQEGCNFPFDDKNNGLVNKFKVKASIGTTAVFFDFYGSINDYNSGKRELKEEDLKHALYCFISDACSAKESFENFCGEFGYDIDSRSAERIYKACGKSLDKYNKLTKADIYDVINALNN